MKFDPDARSLVLCKSKTDEKCQDWWIEETDSDGHDYKDRWRPITDPICFKATEILFRSEMRPKHDLTAEEDAGLHETVESISARLMTGVGDWSKMLTFYFLGVGRLVHAKSLWIRCHRRNFDEPEANQHDLIFIHTGLVQDLDGNTSEDNLHFTVYLQPERYQDLLQRVKAGLINSLHLILNKPKGIYAKDSDQHRGILCNLSPDVTTGVLSHYGIRPHTINETCDHNFTLITSQETVSAEQQQDDKRDARSSKRIRHDLENEKKDMLSKSLSSIKSTLFVIAVVLVFIAIMLNKIF